MSRFAAATLAFAGLAWAPAASALNKCTGPEGRVTYSDLPCPADTKPAATLERILTPSSPASPAPQAAPTAAQGPAPVISYYDVYGNSFETLYTSLLAGAPGSHAALAEWRVSFRYRSNAGPSGCSVSDVSTTLQLSLRMPRWSPPPDAPGELVARWQRFVNGLMAHEEGHLANGRAAEREVKAAVAGLSASDCHTLEAQARERGQAIVAKYTQLDATYDRDTDSGRTQGASFR